MVSAVAVVELHKEGVELDLRDGIGQPVVRVAALRRTSEEPLLVVDLVIVHESAENTGGLGIAGAASTNSVLNVQVEAIDNCLTEGAVVGPSLKE